VKLKIDSACVTDKGLNPHYKVNEDSYLILEKARVFAVADGVGGAHAGDVASQVAMQVIKRGVRKFAKKYKDSRTEFLEKLIQAANNMVYKLGQDRKKQMASTVAIISIENNYAVIGHVGDSRIYLARDSNLLQLTKDHSKLQALLDDNPDISLSRDDYYQGHVITKALGATPEVEPDIQKVFIKNNDLFILCTDGIYTHNSNDEMLDNMGKNKNNLKKACETLKKNCYQNGASDNLTAIVLKVNKSDEGERETKKIKVPSDMLDTVVKKKARR
jgi:protein phosphatase